MLGDTAVVAQAVSFTVGREVMGIGRSKSPLKERIKRTQMTRCVDFYGE